MRFGLDKAIGDLRRLREDRRERASQGARNVHRAELLSGFIAPGGVGAELGVHKGYFSPVLFERLAPAKLYLIDPWYLQGKHWTWGDGNRRVVDALCVILRRLEDRLATGEIALVIEDDLTALARLPDHHLDWVYLDTTHQYEHTVSELALLQRKVRPGGIIAGDDWQPDPAHRHHGVCKAVREFVARENYELLHADPATMQWAIRSR